MGMPNINIIFQELAKTVEARSDNGIVALVLENNGNMNMKEYAPGDQIDTSVAAAAKTQIELALKGGREKPQKVICYFCKSGFEDLDSALSELEMKQFDYLAFGSALTEEQQQKVITWIKEIREEGKKIKAVLPNAAADHEAIINYTTESVTVGGESFTAETFCSRIAGALAGTAITMSVTYTVMGDVEDCTRLRRSELDTKIDNGELVLFKDGEYVRIARGVNSLKTATEGKTEQYKKTKIVDVMDRISTDISTTIKNNWIGQYANTYNNKCLLVAAVQEYFNDLVKRTVLSEAVVEIDLEGNKEYLQKHGKDTVNMSEDEIKQANTGDHVYLKAAVGILDAMEDFEIKITV